MSTTALHAEPAAPLPPPGSDPVARLLHFNDAVLAQAEALAQAFTLPRRAGDVAYGERLGPHLRHVIEHYEALLARRTPGELDYDARARDPLLERSPALARERLAALREALRALDGSDVDEGLFVHTRGGLAGQWPLATLSTVGRELVFLASHAVHHFALVRAHCEQHGITLPAHFGVAPATVAHALTTH
ncbi:MAG: hypothetical protein KIT17_20000 [Rubrivivax sp.]|nr:hypothetical protein [Rubrivivax sp.]